MVFRLRGAARQPAHLLERSNHSRWGSDGQKAAAAQVSSTAQHQRQRRLAWRDTAAQRSCCQGPQQHAWVPLSKWTTSRKVRSQNTHRLKWNPLILSSSLHIVLLNSYCFFLSVNVKKKMNVFFVLNFRVPLGFHKKNQTKKPPTNKCLTRRTYIILFSEMSYSWKGQGSLLFMAIWLKMHQLMR